MPSAQATPEPKKEFFGPLKWVLPIFVAVFIPLYIYGPEVHPRTVFVTCAICDNANEIHPPTSPAGMNTGATITLVVENTGSMGTTLLEHNLTFRSDPEFYQSGKLYFAEDADDNGSTEATIGAHSMAVLTLNRNEGVVYTMRHGLPVNSPNGPIVRPTTYLYGHLRYRRSVGIPTTTNFCFRYVPPNKGLPESWVLCPTDIVEKIESARSQAK
jgi:hypothetical protein